MPDVLGSTAMTTESCWIPQSSGNPVQTGWAGAGVPAKGLEQPPARFVQLSMGQECRGGAALGRAPAGRAGPDGAGVPRSCLGHGPDFTRVAAVACGGEPGLPPPRSTRLPLKSPRSRASSGDQWPLYPSPARLCVRGRLCRAAPGLTLLVLSLSAQILLPIPVRVGRTAPWLLSTFRISVSFPFGVFFWGCPAGPSTAVRSPGLSSLPPRLRPCRPHLPQRGHVPGELQPVVSAPRAVPAPAAPAQHRDEAGRGCPQPVGARGAALGGGGRCQTPSPWRIRSAEPGALGCSQISAHASVGAARSWGSVRPRRCGLGLPGLLRSWPSLPQPAAGRGPAPSCSAACRELAVCAGGRRGVYLESGCGGIAGIPELGNEEPAGADLPRDEEQTYLGGLARRDAADKGGNQRLRLGLERAAACPWVLARACRRACVPEQPAGAGGERPARPAQPCRRAWAEPSPPRSHPGLFQDRGVEARGAGRRSRAPQGRSSSPLSPVLRELVPVPGTFPAQPAPGGCGSSAKIFFPRTWNTESNSCSAAL